MRVLGAIFFLAYPALIYFGLTILEPRILALLLGALLLLRNRRAVTGLCSGLRRTDRLSLWLLGTLTAATFITNSETLLRLYPVAVNLGLLALFGFSLLNQPSLVERIARLRHPDLPPAGVRYTRRVTQIWSAFFAINATAAGWTAFWTDRDTWVLYNGFIAYFLIGALMAGEWLVRRRVMPAHA